MITVFEVEISSSYYHHDGLQSMSIILYSIGLQNKWIQLHINSDDLYLFTNEGVGYIQFLVRDPSSLIECTEKPVFRIITQVSSCIYPTETNHKFKRLYRS